jgi:hypothetical protein
MPPELTGATQLLLEPVSTLEKVYALADSACYADPSEGVYNGTVIKVQHTVHRARMQTQHCRVLRDRRGHRLADRFAAVEKRRGIDR